MLHAAYGRTKRQGKERVNNLTAIAVQNSTNTRILNLIESYRLREPSSVENEIHSIVGTEIREIPVELEEYYSRYFLNRLRVVEYSEQYEAVFVSLKLKSIKSTLICC